MTLSRSDRQARDRATSSLRRGIDLGPESISIGHVAGQVHKAEMDREVHMPPAGQSSDDGEQQGLHIAWVEAGKTQRVWQNRIDRLRRASPAGP